MSVVTLWGAIFGLIWALVAIPVLLAIRLFYWALMGILLVLMPVEWALRQVAKGIVRLVPASARILGAGAAKTAGAARRSWPAVSGAVGEASRRLGARCYSALVFAARWVASAWNDLNGEGEREVNPVALVAKLLVFTAACTTSLILAVDLVLLASSLAR
jgi:hypothetical protein